MISAKKLTLQQEKWMTKYKNHKHRKKPKRMSDAELWLFLFCFIPVASRCFKQDYKESVCKYLKHLFPTAVLISALRNG